MVKKYIDLILLFINTVSIFTSNHHKLFHIAVSLLSKPGKFVYLLIHFAWKDMVQMHTIMKLPLSYLAIVLIPSLKKIQ